MKLNVFDDHTTLSFEAARIICDQIKRKPDSVICFASGETPLAAYNLFTTLMISEQVDSGHFTLVGLDEWVGVPPENPGSCAWFLRTNVIAPLNLLPDQYRLFDGMTSDLTGECTAMDEFISERGGIDLIVVGIGMNGHIGFNEPGVSPDLYAHVIELDKITSAVGQKYFSEVTQLTKGITLGIRHLREAGTAMLLASGERKAPIMKATLEGEISTEVPATIMRELSNGLVLIDLKAASLLTLPE
jgi:glucosamine-6-phosphate isomerase